MKRGLWLIVLILLASPALAFGPFLNWNSTFGGGSSDLSRAIISDGAGGAYVGAQTDSYGAGYIDNWVIHVNSTGGKEWDSVFGTSVDDYGLDITGDGSDGMYVSGQNKLVGANGAWIYQVNSSGDQQWSVTHGGGGWEQAWGIVNGSNNDIFVASYTTSFGAGGYDFWVLRLNSTGGLIWSTPFGGGANDYIQGIELDGTGGVYVTGVTSSFGVGGDMWILRINSTGDQVWAATFGGSGAEIGRELIVDDGGVYVIGSTNSFGAGGNDLFITYFNTSGSQVWNNTYGGVGEEHGYAVRLLNNDIYAVGTTNSSGAGGYDVWLLRLNSTGGVIWNETFGGSGNDYGLGLAIDSQDNLLVSGYTDSYGAGSNDVWVLRVEQWYEVLGNASAVTTSGVTNLSITIDGSESLSGYDGNETLSFFDNGTLLMNMSYDFSVEDLPLENISVILTDNSVVVNVAALAGVTSKTLYLHGAFFTVCVKDAPIASAAQITASCTGASETLFMPSNCPGTTNGITCATNGTVWSFSNLTHSGAQGNSAPVPEFSTIALFAILGLVMGGFVFMRKP
jgi:hypothetical protein